MIIREENKNDEKQVYELVKIAFKSAEQSDGTEQDLVVSLRKSTAFIPQLSLVAEENDEIMGHIMFTKIEIGNQIELALAPLSVLPKFQKQGIGKALMKEGHRIAKDLGFTFSVVLGSENYYPKLGYIPAEQFGIKAPFEVPSCNFMAINLHNKNDKLEGIVKYAKEFGI